MYLVAPEILADACGLSFGLIVLTVPVGLMLWMLGWWSHRFWVVLGTTVMAGVAGLHYAPDYHAPPIVAAVLLALSAGVLALALVRLIAFAAGGLSGMLIVHAAYPALHQPLIVFLICGLVTLLLFRPCLMALTSLAGAVLLVGAALMLLHHYAMLDAPSYSEHSHVLINWIGGLLTVAGFVIQVVLDQYFFRQTSKRKTWVGQLWDLMPSRGSSGGSSKPASPKRAA
jgi:hypothetical protein